MFWRLVFDDRAQDLIEYSLLGALVGIVGIVAWSNVGAAIFTGYRRLDTNVQNLSAITPDPIGGGS
jgi:Flp pilus assembly pilin Flp